MKPTYSIVMPCLLRKKEHIEVVRDCIFSVKQFSKDYEFIFVNDGSPLDTKFIEEYADIVINHKSIKGIACSWNDGMRKASGDYIVIINDDIEVRDGWLESMRKCFDLFPKAMVSAPFVQHMPAGLHPEEKREWFPGSCFMLKKEAKKKIGYFDEQFVPFNYEDVDYWTRVYKKGYTMARDYSVQIRHREGDVIHKVENNGEINSRNRQRYLDKWGFDPVPILYHGTEKFPWEK